MIGCGTRTFTDPDDFRTQAPGFGVELTLTGPAPFRMHVAWADLPCLRVSTFEERAARIGFISLPDDFAGLSFPLHGGPAAYWNGVQLRPGDIALHAPGERFHQRAIGPLHWGLIALPASTLDTYSAALLGDGHAAPRGPAILRLAKAIGVDLLRLHRAACRLAEERPGLVAHREVARSLEQDLVATLINGLTEAEVVDNGKTRKRHSRIMERLEDVLAQQAGQTVSTSELARSTGVPERTLRQCCAHFLGRSPGGYWRLRRLNLARSALTRGTLPAAGIAALAREHGFSDPSRFSTSYRAVFGETPSTTLHRNRSTFTRPAAGG